MSIGTLWTIPYQIPGKIVCGSKRQIFVVADFHFRSVRQLLGVVCRLTYQLRTNITLTIRSPSSCQNSHTEKFLLSKEKMDSSSLKVLRLRNTVCLIYHLIDLDRQ